MANGQLTIARHDHTNRSHRHFLWLQSALRNLRAVHGCRRILWSYGWNSGESAVHRLSRCTYVCSLCARCALYYTRNVCFPRSGCCPGVSAEWVVSWTWLTGQWCDEVDGDCGRYHVRAHWCSHVYSANNGQLTVENRISSDVAN